MTQIQFVTSLQQTKQNIIHSIKELNDMVKSNQQKTIMETLNNILSSIATFDQDYIKGSISSFNHNLEIQANIDRILQKIKQVKQVQPVSILSKQQKNQESKNTLKTTSQIVAPAPKQKEIKLEPISKQTSGILGSVFGKFLGGNKTQKPKAHQMILPQKQSKAVYDKQKKKWIFQGQQEEPEKQIPKPPPKLAAVKSQSPSQNIPTQIKKSMSELDSLTAPPSFKRKGQTKAGGGGKKLVIKQQIVPIAFVQQQNNPFDSLMNLIDKQFYRLQQVLQKIQGNWKNDFQRDMKRKSVQNQKKLKQLLEEVRIKKSSLNEEQLKEIQDLNKQIAQINDISNKLFSQYLEYKENQSDNFSFQNNSFNVQLTDKIMKIARDNRIISHKFRNQTKDKEYHTTQAHQNEIQDLKSYINSLQLQIHQFKILEKPISFQPLTPSHVSQTQLETIKQQLEGLRFDCRILKDQVSEKQKQIQELKVRLNLERQIQKNNYDQFQQALEVKIQKLLQNLTQQKFQKEKLRQQIKSLKEKQQNLKIQNLHILKNTATKNEQQSNFKDLLQSQMRKNQLLTEDVAQLNNRIYQKETDINHLNKEIKEQFIQKQALSSQLCQQFGQKIFSKQQKISVLTQQVSRQSQQLQKIKQQQNKYKIQISSSSHKIIELSEAIQDQKSTKHQLTEQRVKLLQENQEGKQRNQFLKVELLKVEQQRKSLELNLRRQQIIHQQTLKSNLEQLQSFAEQISEQSNLLCFIQSKQQQLQQIKAFTDRSSSQNSSKKSSISNQNDEGETSVMLQQKSAFNSFLNISDILTEITKQYMQKVSQMRYEYTQLEQSYKILNKQVNKQKQRFIQEIQSLKKSLLTSQSLNQGYKKSRKQLEYKINEQQTQIQKLKKRVQHLKRQETSNRQLLEQALEQKHMNNHSISMLRGDKQQMQNKIDDLQEQVQQKNEDILALQQEVNQIKKNVSQQQELMNQKQTIISRLKTKLEQQKQYYENLLQKRQTDLKSIIRVRDQDLSVIKRQLQLTIEKYQKHQRQAKSSKDALVNKLAQIQTVKKQLQKDLKHQQIQNNDLNQQLASKQLQLQKQLYLSKQLNNQLKQFQQTTHKMTLNIQQLKSQVHSLKQQSSEQIIVIEQLNMEKQNLQNHLLGIQQKLGEVTERQCNLSNQLKHQKQEKRNIQTQLKAQIKELSDHLVQLNQYYQEEFANITKQSLQGVKKQKIQLENNLEYAIGRYNQVKTDFEQLKTNMEEKINYLTTELANSFKFGEQLGFQLNQYSQLVQKMGSRIQQLQIQLSQSIRLLQQQSNKTSQKTSQQEQLNQLLQLLDTKQKQIQEENEKKKKLQMQIKSLAKQADEQKQIQKNNKKQLYELIQALREEIQLLKQEKLKVQSEDDRFNQLQNEHKQLTSNYAVIYKMYDDLQAKTSLGESKIKKMRQELAKIYKLTNKQGIQNYINWFEEIQSIQQAGEIFNSQEYSSKIIQIIREIGQIIQNIIIQKQISESKIHQIEEQTQLLVENTTQSQRKVSELNHNINELRLKVQEQKLTIKIQNLTIKENNARIQSLNILNDSQNSKIRQNELHIRQLNQAIDILNQKITEDQSTIEKLNTKILQNNSTKNESEFEQRQNNLKLKENQKKIQQLQQQIEELQASNNQLLVVIQSIEKQKEENERQKQLLNNNRAELTNILQNYRKNEQQLDQKAKVLQKDILELTSKNQALENKMKHDKQSKEGSQSQLVLVLEQVHRQNQQLKYTQQVLKQQVRKLKEQNQQLKNSISALATQLAEQQNEVKHNQNKDKIPKEQFEGLINQYEELLTELQSTKQKLVEFQKTKQRYQMLEDQNYELKEEKSNLLRRKSMQSIEQIVSPAKRSLPQSEDQINEASLLRTGACIINPISKQNQELNEIVIELSSKLEVMESQNYQLISELNQIKQELFNQKQTLHSLKQTINQNDVAIQNLTHDVQNKSQFLNQKISQIKDKDAIIQGLSNELQSKNQELRRALEEKAVLSTREKSEELIETVRQQEQELSKKNDNISEIEELLQTLNEQLQDKKLKQSELLQIVSQQELQIAMLKQKINELKEELSIHKITQNISKEEQSSQENQENKKQPQSQSSQLYQVIQEMQKDLQDKNQQIQQLNVLIDRLNDDVRRDSSNSIANLNEASQRVDDDFLKTKQKRNSQDQLLTQVEDNLQRLGIQIKEKQNEIENQKMYNQILREQEEQLKQRIGKLQQSNDNLKTNCQQLKTLNQSLNQQIQQLTDQLGELRREVGELNLQIEEFNMRNQDTNKQLQEARQQLQKLKTQLKQQQKFIKSAQNLEQLEVLVQSMQQELSQKDQQLLSKSNEIHKLKQIQMQIKQKLQILQQKLQEKDQSLKEMQEMVLAASTEVNQLNSENNDLRQKDNNQSLLHPQLSQPLKNISNQSVQIQRLKQHAMNLESEINLQKKIVLKKEQEIQEMNELINSQAIDNEKLQDKIKLLDQQLIGTIQKYNQKLKAEIEKKQISKMKQQAAEGLQNANQLSQDKDNSTLLKVQLQEAYEELRACKIQIDELRKNIFDVNQMFTERQTKYQSKISSLEKQLLKYQKSKQSFGRYENTIKELQLQITSLSSQKAEFLRIIDKLQSQISDYQNKINGQKTAATGRQIQRKEPQSDQKSNARRSEIVDGTSEVKPTGFFSSISSLFMTPIQTERMAKVLGKK